jgi:hypothetical protein
LGTSQPLAALEIIDGSRFQLMQSQPDPKASGANLSKRPLMGEVSCYSGFCGWMI